jgi:hypothetical protein
MIELLTALLVAFSNGGSVTNVSTYTLDGSRVVCIDTHYSEVDGTTNSETCSTIQTEVN